ncbi:hypothetical protein EDB84DRAFT_1672952 [Lactarius hengduanensis]|nr:hypothetical protein EDB84DRAFT_1672952 [Lactarius hengduanensis]
MSLTALFEGTSTGSWQQLRTFRKDLTTRRTVGGVNAGAEVGSRAPFRVTPAPRPFLRSPSVRPLHAGGRRSPFALSREATRGMSPLRAKRRGSGFWRPRFACPRGARTGEGGLPRCLPFAFRFVRWRCARTREGEEEGGALPQAGLHPLPPSVIRGLPFARWPPACKRGRGAKGEGGAPVPIPAAPLVCVSPLRANQGGRHAASGVARAAHRSRVVFGERGRGGKGGGGDAAQGEGAQGGGRGGTAGGAGVGQAGGAREEAGGGGAQEEAGDERTGGRRPRLRGARTEAREDARV